MRDAVLVEPILNDDFGRDLDELAHPANEWRNELAHEKESMNEISKL